MFCLKYTQKNILRKDCTCLRIFYGANRKIIQIFCGDRRDCIRKLQQMNGKNSSSH